MVRTLSAQTARLSCAMARFTSKRLPQSMLRCNPRATASSSTSRSTAVWGCALNLTPSGEKIRCAPSSGPQWRSKTFRSVSSPGRPPSTRSRFLILRCFQLGSQPRCSSLLFRMILKNRHLATAATISMPEAWRATARLIVG